MAPILSFTSEEVWEYLPGVAGREASVHLALFPSLESIYPDDAAELLSKWKQIFAVRDRAMLVLEEARQEKRIGKGLEAELEISSSGELLELLRSHAGGLKEILNVSKVTVLVAKGGAELSIVALPASGSKCARCWNFMPLVSDYGAWESVCTRCQEALTAMGIERPAADGVGV